MRPTRHAAVEVEPVLCPLACGLACRRAGLLCGLANRLGTTAAVVLAVIGLIVYDERRLMLLLLLLPSETLQEAPWAGLHLRLVRLGRRLLQRCGPNAFCAAAC